MCLLHFCIDLLWTHRIGSSSRSKYLPYTTRFYHLVHFLEFASGIEIFMLIYIEYIDLKIRFKLSYRIGAHVSFLPFTRDIKYYKILEYL